MASAKPTRFLFSAPTRGPALPGTFQSQSTKSVPCTPEFLLRNLVISVVTTSLADYSRRLSRARFILSQPGKTRMPQMTVRRPLGELDLGHELGFL